MSIKSGGSELFVGKEESNIITFAGNKIKIPYKNLKKIEYFYPVPAERGYFDFINNDGHRYQFEFDSKNNDKIQRAIEYIKEKCPHVEIEEKTINDLKIYQRNWFIAILLFLLTPVGLCLMWKYKKHSRITMAMLSLFFIGLWIFSFQIWTFTENSGGMTIDKYNACKIGMTYPECVEIIGFDGIQLAETKISDVNSITYIWYGNETTGTNSTMNFTNGKLITKAQYGLR